MALQRIVTVTLLIGAVSSEIISSCSLLNQLKPIPDLLDNLILDNTVGDYVCLANYVSGFNTSLHTSPDEYGIFQINSTWCDDGVTKGLKNLCRVLCKDLLDNEIKNDLQCLERIVQDPNGLDAWPAWTEKCKGQDLNQYINVCNI